MKERPQQPAITTYDDLEGCMCYGDDCSECGGESCHTCGGEGWGIVGCDWDSDDPINGPYDGEVQRCWNCKGSGDAKDCWFF